MPENQERWRVTCGVCRVPRGVWRGACVRGACVRVRARSTCVRGACVRARVCIRNVSCVCVCRACVRVVFVASVDMWFH